MLIQTIFVLFIIIQ